jgi:hypothetical protein
MPIYVLKMCERWDGLMIKYKVASTTETEKRTNNTQKRERKKEKKSINQKKKATA